MLDNYDDFLRYMEPIAERIVQEIPIWEWVVVPPTTPDDIICGIPVFIRDACPSGTLYFIKTTNDNRHMDPRQ